MRADAGGFDHAPAIAMPLSMMIGTSGTGNSPGARTMRTNWAPSIIGISQSTMTRSGLCCRIASRPAAPSGAS
jgi:hypothetical protein